MWQINDITRDLLEPGKSYPYNMEAQVFIIILLEATISIDKSVY